MSGARLPRPLPKRRPRQPSFVCGNDLPRPRANPARGLGASDGMALALPGTVREPFEEWENDRQILLGQRISSLGLSLQGSLVERLVTQLYEELGAKGLTFRPPVYLSDQWGCPDDTPLIGVPFYLADPRLARIEEENAV